MRSGTSQKRLLPSSTPEARLQIINPEINVRGVPLFRHGFILTFIVLSVLGTLNVINRTRQWRNYQGEQMIRNLPWNWAEDNVQHADKGLVMCVGDDEGLIADAIYTIGRIRKSFKSSLPITVAHCSELSRDTTKIFRTFQNVSVQDICFDTVNSKQRQRLRGWFCKTQALILSNYNETMLIDTDALFFKDPSKLFSSPKYLEKGALFFRDRMLFESSSEKDGLHYEDVVEFIRSESSGRVNITPATAMSQFVHSGYNFFWLHGVNSTKYRPIRHIQESSVVIFNRNRLSRTISVLRKILPKFRLGYGDKEIYWIAATIAGDTYAFEPFFAGIYGDCGEIFHFDPTFTPYSKSSTPFFLNGQYIVEGKVFVGKNIQEVISSPVIATEDTPLFEMGKKSAETAGRCGACQVMGPCTPTSQEINAEIRRFQAFKVGAAKKAERFWLFRKVSGFFKTLSRLASFQ